MRYVKVKMTEDLFKASKAFAAVTGSSVDGIVTRLVRAHIKQHAPALLREADEYQRDAINSATSTMPDMEPAEDLG